MVMDKEKLNEAIKKYKELFDMGVISEEEYEQKKQTLLEELSNTEEVNKNIEVNNDNLVIGNFKIHYWLMWVGFVLLFFFNPLIMIPVMLGLRIVSTKKDKLNKSNALYKFFNYSKFEKFNDGFFGIIFIITGIALLSIEFNSACLLFMAAGVACFEFPYKKIKEGYQTISEKSLVILRITIPIGLLIVSGIVFGINAPSNSKNVDKLNSDVEENNINIGNDQNKDLIVENNENNIENNTVADNNLDKEVTENSTSNNQENSVAFEGNDLKTNFIKACNAIGIDVSQIKNLTKLSDWSNGARYSFSYKGMGMRAYCNADNTINSINIGSDAKYKLYLEGYEPINIDKFIVDEGIFNALIPITEDNVKVYLNYPSTANFALLGWGCSRCEDIYALSGSVEAQNAFGVKDEIKFYAEYKIKDKTSSLVYLVVGGITRVGKESQMKEFERVEIKQQASESGKIVLTDGICGTYGKKVKVGSYEYVWYYVPAGKYLVTSNVKWCNVFIDKNKTIRNSDGYEESVNVKTLTFTAVGQQQEFEIKDGQHILLTENAKVTLEKQ